MGQSIILENPSQGVLDISVWTNKLVVPLKQFCKEVGRNFFV